MVWICGWKARATDRDTDFGLYNALCGRATRRNGSVYGCMWCRLMRWEYAASAWVCIWLYMVPINAVGIRGERRTQYDAPRTYTCTERACHLARAFKGSAPQQSTGIDRSGCAATLEPASDVSTGLIETAVISTYTRAATGRCWL